VGKRWGFQFAAFRPELQNRTGNRNQPSPAAQIALKKRWPSPGERVWIRHSTEVWEPAVVDAVDGLRVQVHAVGGARELTFKDTATLEDGVKRRNEGDIATVDDLVRLPFLHEPAILHVLRSRARAGLIYTNVGAILLAVNPFKRLPELYGNNAVETQRSAGALRAADPESAQAPPPHCFAVADQAYCQMRSALTGRKPADQAILISGESGAGKTETTKFVNLGVPSCGGAFTPSTRLVPISR
jgi:Myosin heavy chain